MTVNTLHFKSWPQDLPHTIEDLPKTLYESLATTASKYPERKAVIFYETEMSYRSLFRQVNIIRSFLTRFNTVKPGDRIILYMQNCPQFIVSFYGVLGANCVLVPVNPMLQPDEIRNIILDSGAKFVIVATELLDNLLQAISQNRFKDTMILATNYSDSVLKKFNVKLPDELVARFPELPRRNLYYWKDALKTKVVESKHNRKLSDLSIIPYTSGTTGKPKGCEHTYQSVNAVIHAYSEWLPLPESSKILASLPLFHVTGMQNSMNVPIFRGDTIVLMIRWNVDTALYLIQKYKIRSWRSITTSIIDLLSEFDPNNHDLSSLVSIGGGGAPMPKKLATKLNAITSLNYVEAYGMTETMAPTHINPPNQVKLGSIGIPIFNVDARVIDVSSGSELGVNDVGELILSGPQLFSGYWNDSKSSMNAFLYIDGKKFLKTGDLAYFDSDGYFYILDRLKRMIIISGFKVWPAEVEKILLNHPDILEVCVVGVPDERTGQKVKAVIIPRKNTVKQELLCLERWCKTRMAKYKIPKIIEMRDKLPKNRVGKILWRQVT